MELIRGEPLTVYADCARLGPRERLELAADVCDALQHAHQRGVIHRDLKPANILVDAHGKPKIVDFGVARVTNADIQTVTVQTDVGQLIGTVPYMSPEQLSGDSRQLDTRSDIYAMGVILYELLIGAVPHDVRNLTVAEAAARIREREPRRLGSIDRSLRGDVETIVTRALEKDKGRRYQSAADLAADIRRYLADELIEARRDSALYVLRKTVGRYRGVVTSGALLVVLLIAFGAISFVQARRNQELAANERAARQYADASSRWLAAELTASNIERGRLFTRTGDCRGAEDMIWREHLANPRSNHSYWALWELYSHNPDLASFAGNKQEAFDVDFAPDGHALVSGSVDGSVKVWDADTYELLVPLDGHSASVSSVAFSPNGRMVASASLDGTVAVWDVATGKSLHTLEAHHDGAYSVDFSPGGEFLVSGGGDTLVRVWDVQTGECVYVLEEHQARVGAVCFNDHTGMLATNSNDGTIKIWKTLFGPSSLTVVDPAGATRALAFSSDGSRLATGNRDRVIKIWNLDNPPEVKTLGTATNGHVRYLAFGPDGETLFSGGWYRIDRWNLVTGKRRTVVTYGTMGGGMRPDGRVIVAGFDGGTIRVTDVLTDAGEIRLGGKSNRGVASVSIDGRMIACGDDEDHVRLWETETGRLLAKVPASTGRWSSAHFHPSGRLFATCGADGVVSLWDLTTGELVWSCGGAHVTSGQSLAFSPDGRTMAVTWPDQTVQLRNALTGDLLAVLPSVGSEALAVRISPDGRMIATTHRDNIVALWTAAGNRLGTLVRDTAPWMVDFQPNGRKLAVGGWSRQFQIWDLDARTLEASLGESSAVIWGVAFMPTNPRIIATCSGDGSVELWDLDQRQNLLTLEPFGGSDALSVSFTPDGKTLVAAGYDGSLCVWDLQYYDRHIVGNIEHQIGRLEGELGGRIQAESLRNWAREVLRRPWPRIGPHAPKRIQDAGDAFSSVGVDPDVIAAWGRATLIAGD
jgi:WD40 repeat protein